MSTLKRYISGLCTVPLLAVYMTGCSSIGNSGSLISAGYSSSASDDDSSSLTSDHDGDDDSDLSSSANDDDDSDHSSSASDDDNSGYYTRRHGKSSARRHGRGVSTVFSCASGLTSGLCDTATYRKESLSTALLEYTVNSGTSPQLFVSTTQTASTADSSGLVAHWYYARSGLKITHKNKSIRRDYKASSSTLTNPDFNADYQYVKIFDLAYTDTSGTSNVEKQIFGYAGIATASSDMPTTGTASYTGISHIEGTLDHTPTGGTVTNISVNQTGTSEINANFATNQLAFRLSFDEGPVTTLFTGSLTGTDNYTWTINGAAFSPSDNSAYILAFRDGTNQNLPYSYSDSTPEGRGQFFGDADNPADELAAVFNISDSYTNNGQADINISGYLTGK